MSLLSITKIAVFSVVFVISNSLCSAPLAVGDVAPNWILQNKDGEMVSLYQQAEEGNTTVMFFWASWCPMCKDLIPELNRIKTSLEEKSVSVYFLNVWENKSAKTLNEEESHWPVLIGADGVAKRYEIDTTPAAIVVGKDKLIKYRNAAVRNGSSFITDITALLLLKPASQQIVGQATPQPASSSLKSSNKSKGSTSSPSN